MSLDLAAVADELATVLAGVTGLRAFGYPAPSVVPPVAMVGWPDEIDPHATFARGGWTCTFPVLIAVGKGDVRSARDAVTGYLNSTGSGSVLAAFANGRGTAYDSAIVTSARVEPITIAGIEYLAALLDVAVMGTGA